MEVSYEEALAVCIAHYAERGVEFQPRLPEEVFRIYGNIQEENERKKHIGIRISHYIGGLPVYETYIMDDTDPAASQ
jgi:hypothetical protein